MAHLLADAVRTHDRALALIARGRAPEAVEAASGCMLKFSKKGDMQVTCLSISNEEHWFAGYPLQCHPSTSSAPAFLAIAFIHCDHIPKKA